MYSKGKYIVGEVDTACGMSMMSAVCFSEALGHIDVAKLFSEIHGAGFFNVNIDADGQQYATAYGKSVGLGIESRGEQDSKQIDRALGLNPL